MLQLKGPTLAPFEMKDRRLVHRYSVFGVERHDLHQHGKKLRDVDTFEMRDWCNIVAVTEANELVLVWQWRFGTQRFSLETPGGVIDEGETPEHAARRELLEETGYEASEWAPLLENDPNPALQGNRCFSFLATNARKVREPGGGDCSSPAPPEPRGQNLPIALPRDWDEQLEVELVAAKHATRLVLEGHVRHCLCQMALLAYALRCGG